MCPLLYVPREGGRERNVCLTIFSLLSKAGTVIPLGRFVAQVS